MNKSQKKARTLKKVLAAILAMSMLLTGCGESDTKETAVTTQSTVTAEEVGSTQAQEHATVREPNQVIGGEVKLSEKPTTEATDAITTEATEEVTEPVTEEPTSGEATSESTTPEQTGKYSYDYYGIELKMDVNIDDYIIENSEGRLFFKTSVLAKELGWKAIDEGYEGFPYEYRYDIDDMTVYCKVTRAKTQEIDWFGYDRLGSVDYVFYKKSDHDYDYYYPQSTEIEDSKKGAIVDFDWHEREDYEYIIYSDGSSSGCSREDIIIVAYLLSNVQRDVKNNPFAAVLSEMYGKYGAGAGWAYMRYLMP